jgi:TonB-dependent receptor
MSGDKKMGSNMLKSKLLAGAMALTGAAFATSAFAQTAASADAPVATAPHKPETIGEIVVVANRYQAADAQLRAVNNISVLSAEDLEHTAVHNAAEALGLLPGVSVLQTGSGFQGGVDGAARGTGQAVGVQGLNAEYTLDEVNGVDVSVGNPYSRALQISLLPPGNLSTVVLSTSSTAAMDGQAIGGTVNFNTPSAYDRKGDQGGSFQLGGRYESRAADYGKDPLGENVNGEYYKKFGAGNQFGFYASAYYDYRNFDNSLVGGIDEAGCCDFGWDFAVQGNKPSQNSAPGLNPANNLILTGANFGVAAGYEQRYGGTSSFDWRPDATTSFYARMTYAYDLTREDNYKSQIVAEAKQDGNSGAAIGTTGLYQPILGGISTRFWYETNPETAILSTVQFGGEKTFGRLTVSGNVFGSYGSDDRPDHIEVAARVPDPGLAYGGSTIFTSPNGGLPQPLLFPAARASIYNIANMPLNNGDPELTKAFSYQVKGGGKLDIKYDFDNEIIKNIMFGAKYEDSFRNQTNRDYTDPSYGSATTVGQLGIANGSFKSAYPGLYTWSIPQINQSKLFSLFYALDGGNINATLDSCGSRYLANEYNCNTQSATQAIASTYASVDFNIRGVEIIPGFRFEHVDIHNTFWDTVNGGNDLGNFNSNDAQFNEPLPSLAINYRPSPRTVYRAAIWTSYQLPPFLDLGGGQQTSVSNGVTSITQGNPNLKPIEAVNYNLSGEWDSGAGGHAVIEFYYKDLKHYIFDAGANSGLSANLPGTGSTTVYNEPENGGSGFVAGVEISVRQKFRGLPDPFDGLGVSGNLTRQTTGVNILPGRPIEQIQNAPSLLGNASVFYEKHGLDVELLLNYQGAMIEAYDQLSQGANWDDEWVRPVTTLNLHAGYMLPHGLKADFSITNLTGSYSYWAHVGKNSYVISDVINDGSTALFTVTWKY